MDEAALLTDDEIVALCAVDGRPWPLGLITVGATTAEMVAAGMRGMRSLLVRQLATEAADGSGVRPHESLARDVVGFLDATRRVGAYVAPASDHSVLAGAAVTAAQTSDGWLLDTVTAAGVHALRRASADESAGAIVELVEQAYSGTFFDSADDPTAWVCVVRYGQDPAEVIAVGKGSPAHGWDASLIRDVFRDG